MCGIAGYSLSAFSDVDRTLAAQALLAGIAERGADAVGYAHRAPGGRVQVHKQRSGASALLDRIEIPGDATQVLLHVRDYTKGHPRIEANNHPIRHGAVVGIHNGIIVNDEELLDRHGIVRAHPQMTVDSEAIFALVDESGPSPYALDELRGSMATAWVDERRESSLFLARGVGRPLWIGECEHGAFFASTEATLQIVERYVGLSMSKREIAEGRLVEVAGGACVRETGFSPDRSFQETQKLPAVRAPREREVCLSLLASLAA
jgi:glucosamine 6-phosphate synthetase-like amidotransferase/phosphosugar isomerase protein